MGGGTARRLRFRRTLCFRSSDRPGTNAPGFDAPHPLPLPAVRCANGRRGERRRRGLSGTQRAAHASFRFFSGSERTGLPVAAKMAFITAGATTQSNTFAVGMTLFTRFLWPFELASFLILLAIIAAIVIAKKDKPQPALGGKDGAH